MSEPSENTGSVKITLADVYALLQDVASKVNAMEPHKGALNDHEARLRSVERGQWKWSGAAAAVGALLGLVGDKILGP